MKAPATTASEIEIALMLPCHLNTGLEPETTKKDMISSAAVIKGDGE